MAVKKKAAAPKAAAAAAAPAGATAAAATTPPAAGAGRSASAPGSPTKKQPKHAASGSKKQPKSLDGALNAAAAAAAAPAGAARITVKRRRGPRRTWTPAELSKAFPKMNILDLPEPATFHPPSFIEDSKAKVRIACIKDKKQVAVRLAGKGLRMNWFNQIIPGGNAFSIRINVPLGKNLDAPENEWYKKLLVFDNDCREFVIMNRELFFKGYAVMPSEENLRRDFEPSADPDNRAPEPIYTRMVQTPWKFIMDDGTEEFFGRIDLIFRTSDGVDMFFAHTADGKIQALANGVDGVVEAVQDGNYFDFVVIPKGVHSSERFSGMPLARPNFEVCAIIAKNSVMTVPAEAAEAV